MGLDYLEYMDYFGLPRSGIIHVGANHALESRFYDAYGKVPVAFFEPIPDVYEKAVANTAKYPSQRVFHACCTDSDGDEITFNISSNRGMSSSIFPLGRHGDIVPGVRYVENLVMRTSRVDTILKEHYRLDDFNLAVIDTQGADLLVVRGLGRFIDYLDAIYIEVSDTPLYEGGASFHEIYRYLDALGFNLAMLKTTNTDWGNAFFKRRRPLHIQKTQAAISRDKPVRMSSILGNRGPELGVDGDITTRRKFFHTREEDSPWWEVDLGRVTLIKEILLYDRLGQEERSKNLIAEVSETGHVYEIVYDRGGIALKKGQVLTSIPWKGAIRFVRVRLTERGYLHLRQVAVIEDEFLSRSIDVQNRALQV